MRRLRTLITTAVLIGSASACSGSVSIGGGSISSDELSSQVSDSLEAQFGQAPEDVTCPDDLEGTVDASTTCVLTDAGSEYDVAVTVTSVDDGTASFDLVVADAPNE